MGTLACNGPDEIKFEENEQNNLYATGKLLPECEFGTRIDLDCFICTCHQEELGQEKYHTNSHYSVPSALLALIFLFSIVQCSV